MRKQKGFSLIELLIVVAIILIIAAIRTIITGQIQYQSSLPNVGYAANLTALGPNGAASPCVPDPAGATGACLIDSQLASGVKTGYNVSTASAGGVPKTSFAANASPVTRNQTGTRDFCAFEDAVVRVSPALVPIGTCPPATPPLQ